MPRSTFKLNWCLWPSSISHINQRECHAVAPCNLAICVQVVDADFPAANDYVQRWQYIAQQELKPAVPAIYQAEQSCKAKTAASSSRRRSFIRTNTPKNTNCRLAADSQRRWCRSRCWHHWYWTNLELGHRCTGKHEQKTHRQSENQTCLDNRRKLKERRRC